MRKYSSLNLLYLVVFILTLFAFPAQAQRARQQGFVLDEDKNPVPNIEVKFDRIESAAGNIHQVSKTDESGKFVFANLNGGMWKLSIEAKGYMPFENMYNVSSFSRNANIVVILKAVKEAPKENNVRSEAQGAMDEAKALVDEGKYDDAIALYRDFLTKHEDLTQVRLLIGEIYEKKGDKDSAEKEYLAVLEKDENDATALRMLGDLYVKAIEYDKAKPYYLRLAELRPNDPNILYTTGEILISTGDTDDAITYYGKAVEANPSFADAQMKLGFALSEKGEVAGAIEHLEKFLELVPNHPYASLVKDEIEKLKAKQ